MRKRRRKRVHFRKPKIRHRVETLKQVARPKPPSVQPAPPTIYRPWLFPCGSPNNPDCVQPPVVGARPDGKNPGTSPPPITTAPAPRGIFPGEDEYTPITGGQDFQQLP